MTVETLAAEMEKTGCEFCGGDVTSCDACEKDFCRKCESGVSHPDAGEFCERCSTPMGLRPESMPFVAGVL